MNNIQNTKINTHKKKKKEKVQPEVIRGGIKNKYQKEAGMEQQVVLTSNYIRYTCLTVNANIQSARLTKSWQQVITCSHVQ